jgi:hypothetical protein
MDEETFTPSGPTSPTGPDPRQRRRYLLPVAAALLGLALAAAACSSGPSTPGVAGSGSGTPTTAASTSNQGMPTLTPAQKAAQLAYSQCMQSHGVPNFPDPDSQGRILIQGGPGSSLDPGSATFKNAENKCKSKQPQPTPAQQAQAEQYGLRVARCMRAHGIKDYPDPGPGGRIQIRLSNNPGSDLNPNNPLFQRAQAKCMPNAPKLPGGKNTTSGSGGSGQMSSGGG